MTDENVSDVMRKLTEFGEKVDRLSEVVAELKAAHITPQQVDDKIAEASKKSRERMDDTLKDFKAHIMKTVTDTLNETVRQAADSLTETVNRASKQMTDYQNLLDQRDKNHEAAAAMRTKAIEELEERVEQTETNALIAKTRSDEIAMHLYGDKVNKGLIDQFKESLEIIAEIRDLKKAEDKRAAEEAERKKEVHATIMTVLNYFPKSKRGKRIASSLALPVSGASYYFVTNFGSIVSWIVSNASQLLGG